MKDSMLHILLGSAYAAIVYLLLFLPTSLAVFSIACFILFIREVTQEQQDYDNDIRKGWDFWNWGEQKKLETWLPIASLLLIGSALFFV